VDDQAGRGGAVNIPTPRSGDVVVIGRAASVQFQEPIRMRVIEVDQRTSCPGWAWLHGFQLNEAGDATERRSVFVQLAGLYRPPGTPPPPTPWRR
jgi:hypothetical protein